MAPRRKRSKNRSSENKSIMYVNIFIDYNLPYEYLHTYTINLSMRKEFKIRSLLGENVTENVTKNKGPIIRKILG